jgi:prolipoprotein diacylglyceryltransferase
MGQLLSTPMIVLGIGLLWWAYTKNAAPNNK